MRMPLSQPKGPITPMVGLLLGVITWWMDQVRVPCQDFMQGFLPTALSYCKDNAMGTL